MVVTEDGKWMVSTTLLNTELNLKNLTLTYNKTVVKLLLVITKKVRLSITILVEKMLKLMTPKL